MARRRGGKAIDYKRWVFLDDVAVTTAADGTSPLGEWTNPDVPGTILRVRGQIAVEPTASTYVAYTDLAGIAFGLGIFNVDLVAAGGAYPDPLGEARFPWLWWHATVFSPQTTTPSGGSPLESQLITYDTKAMRKIKPAETLVMVMQYLNASGNPEVRVINAGGRVLFGT